MFDQVWARYRGVFVLSVLGCVSCWLRDNKGRRYGQRKREMKIEVYGVTRKAEVCVDRCVDMIAVCVLVEKKKGLREEKTRVQNYRQTDRQMDRCDQVHRRVIIVCCI